MSPNVSLFGVCDRAADVAWQKPPSVPKQHADKLDLDGAEIYCHAPLGDSWASNWYRFYAAYTSYFNSVDFNPDTPITFLLNPCQASHGVPPGSGFFVTT